MSAELRRDQQRLADLGYYQGAVDGEPGPRTTAAVIDFQLAHGLREDGRLGPKTRAALREALLASDDPQTAAEAAVPDAKPWWASRAVIGAAVIVAAQIAAGFGWNVDVGVTTDAALSLVTLLGAGLAWWGRVSAQRPVSRKLVAPGVRLPGPDIDERLRDQVRAKRRASAERSAADLGREAWLGD